MKTNTLLAFVASAASLAASQAVTGTFPPVPLASKHFDSPNDLPYKVDTDEGLIRGHQAGYNMCNSTTENQQSMCQTAYFNSYDDFCIWGPSEPESIVANTEGEMVAWCTKPGHGTRLIPEGALTGLQWIKTPDYVQAVGFLSQPSINIKADDWGGEMDPHGADLRGNPMGGLVFSSAFGDGTAKQVIEWHNFIGGGRFCMKACDPAGPNAAHFCEHVFDRIGCGYNIPNNAKDGVFEHCKGDNQDYPGIYTDASGAVQTYTQPPEDQGSIQTMPYQPKVPASSECVTFTSSAVYTGLPTATTTPKVSLSGSGAAAAAAATGTAKATGASGTGAKAASQTGAASAAENGSNELAVSLVASFAGVVFAAAFLS